MRRKSLVGYVCSVVDLKRSRRQATSRVAGTRIWNYSASAADNSPLKITGVVLKFFIETLASVLLAIELEQ